jgi:hypothetical protein
MTVAQTCNTGAPVRPALARCLAIDPEEFLDRHFGCRLLHTPATALPADFTDLFSIDAVNQILSTGGLRTSSLRLVREDQQLDPAGYGRPGGGDRPGESPYVDPDRVAAALRGGHSLVLRSLHRHYRPLMVFAHQLSADLGYPVHINAYVTPAGAQAVKTHYDTHDVLVLQIAGDKTWEIRTPILTDPLAGQAWQEMGAARRQQLLAASEPVTELTLRPGDTFHLPRGFLHSARASSGVSIQLTIAVLTTTRYDLLQSLITLAQDDEWYRQRVPMHDPGAAESLLAGLVPELARRLAASATPETAHRVLRHLDQLRWADLPPEPVPVLSPDPPVSYRARAGVHYRIDETGHQLTVHTQNCHLILPIAAAHPVRAALSASRLDPARPPTDVETQPWQEILAALATIGLLIPNTEQANYGALC